MFEREIKFIYDFNLNKVKQLGAHITFPALKAAPLHPAIIQYISAEIDYLIYEDRKYLLQNSSFDYSNEEISKYFLLINDEIKKEKKLSFDYIDQLILQAASFTVNYLVQPAWSLSKLIFEKEENIPVSEARQIISYIYYYEYLKNIIEKYFGKKKLVNVNRTEFEALLEKIDREVFDKYSEKLLDKVLFSMGDFFNIGSINKNSVPLSALELFLKEKKLEQYLERIKNACYPDPKSSYDITEIRKILYSPVPLKKDRYLDRIIKQEIPDSVFKTHVKPQDEDTVPEILQHESENKLPSDPDTLKPEINPEFDSTASGETPSEPGHLENQEEIPFGNEATALNVSEQEQAEGILPDKEDPGNLDSSGDSVDDEIFPAGNPEADHKTFDSPIKSDIKNNLINEGITADNENVSDEDFVFIDPADHSSDKSVPEIIPETNSSDLSEQQEEVNKTDSDRTIEIATYEKRKEPEQFESPPDDEEAVEDPMTARTKRNEISSFLSGKDMDRIITNVFNEDTEDFALTFEKIADCQSEEEALGILDQVLNSNHVKPASRDALILRRIINEYYNQ